MCGGSSYSLVENAVRLKLSGLTPLSLGGNESGAVE